MKLIRKLFPGLFAGCNCLIYTAFGSEEYFRVVNKLQVHGVKYRTKTYNHDYHSTQFFARIDNTQYDIYVRSEDEHRAQQAIHC